MDPNHLWWTVFLSCIACIFSFFCYACSMLHFILLRTIPPWYNSIYFHCITCKHLLLFIILGITWSMWIGLHYIHTSGTVQYTANKTRIPHLYSFLLLFK
jgi:hypothetical protein